jgi:hypothetical protein
VIHRQSGFPFLSYGFRAKSGKAIVAYWIAAHGVPGNSFPPYYAALSLKNSGIQHPVLIDESLEILVGSIGRREQPTRWRCFR